MCIFALSRTTSTIQIVFPDELWIASKCVSLHYHVQLRQRVNTRYIGCELLQNVYLCIITYNALSIPPSCVYVVNCFKMCIFALSRTTQKAFNIVLKLLWIASKCVSLHYHVQLSILMSSASLVVNCFKMCIFALSRTTCFACSRFIRWLWIASKCVSLHYHVQH